LPAGTRRRARGQAFVELAIVLPVLLLLVLAALDLGRLFYSRITVYNAAREGAFIGAYYPTSFSSGSGCNASSNKIMCAVTNETTNSFVTVAPSDVSRTCNPGCAAPGTVTVSVTGHFSLVTPLLGCSPAGRTSRSARPTPTPTATPTPTPTAPGATPTPTPTPTATPSCALPVPGFNYSQQNKNKPVVFTSISTPTSGTCAITFWRWEFGDGEVAAGNLASVSHDYNREKTTFSVRLTVTNPAGVASVERLVTTK
jgi:Flp pilus assembly protein TadG